MILGLLVTLVSILLIVVVAQALEKSGHTAMGGKKSTGIDAEKVILRLNFDKHLETGLGSEQERFLRQIFTDHESLSLMQLQNVAEKAGKDPKVVGALLDLSGFGGGLTNTSAARRILVNFSNSGKGIHAFLPSVGTEQLFLASAAQKIMVPQIGEAMIFGSTMTSTFFGGLMEKIGVSFSLVRAGKYKSFGEAFIRNDPSDEAKMMNEALVASLNQSLVAAIAVGRSVPVSQVEEWFKKSIYTAPEAVAAGIVDEVGTEKRFLDLAEQTWADAEIVSFERYAASLADDGEAGAAIGDVDGVGYLEAVGEIADDSLEADPEAVTPNDLIKQLRWMKKNDLVKSVVLRVDSPGGSALASDLIADAVRDLNAVKPVVVSMGSVAASGGYYIAAPASKILAEAGTITGSIGVFGLLPNLSLFREKYGLSFHTYSGSDRRAMLDPGLQPAPEDLRLVEAQVAHIYRTFLKVVGKGRKMQVNAVDGLAGGRVWTGAQALESGLVDELGGLHESFLAAKALGGLDVEKKVPIHRYERENFLEECLGGMSRLMRCLRTGGADLRLARAWAGAMGLLPAWTGFSGGGPLAGDEPALKALAADVNLRAMLSGGLPGPRVLALAPRLEFKAKD